LSKPFYYSGTTTEKSPINDTFVSRMIGTIHVPESNSLNQETRPEQLEVCVELASLTLYAAKTLENNLELIKKYFLEVFCQFTWFR
jgi:hypothetical protein